MHGPTFMGNALACRAALASIELFESGNYMEKIAHIEEVSRRELKDLSSPLIREIRIMGGCTCVETVSPEVLDGFQEFAYQHGVFSRPFLRYMYTMVPYIIEDSQLIQIFDTMKEWFSRFR